MLTNNQPNKQTNTNQAHAVSQHFALPNCYMFWPAGKHLLSVASSVSEANHVAVQQTFGCVRVTTLPPSCAECLVICSLNLLDPSGPRRAVTGILHPFLHSNCGSSKYENKLIIDTVYLGVDYAGCI